MRVSVPSRRRSSYGGGLPGASPRATGAHRRHSLLWWLRGAAFLTALALATLVLLRAPPHLGEDEEAARAPLPRTCTALRESLAPAPASPSLRPWRARSALYAAIAADFARAGFAGVSPAGGTQGMAVSALFSWDAATDLPRPRLRRLPVPVRAVVLPLPPASPAVAAMAAASREALLDLCGAPGVWLQDPEAYHLSLFHASHHLQPVAADAQQLRAEADAVAAVMNTSCPVSVVLERVVVTRGGVFIACWNVLRGAEPEALRAALRAALPRAPETQLVTDAPILHSTLARVLRSPHETAASSAAALGAVASALSKRLCGLRAVLDAAWFVAEHDALALALRGAYDATEMPLQCASPEADFIRPERRAAALGGRALDSHGR
jgi:hypothetical protein